MAAAFHTTQQSCIRLPRAAQPFAAHDAMITHQLAYVMSGESEFSHWVTLGYRPAPDHEAEERALHVEVAKTVDEQDVATGMDSVFLQHDHQGNSGYGDASRIVVEAGQVTFEWVEGRGETLEFADSVRFANSANLAEFEAAIARFGVMASLPCGSSIEAR